MPNLYLLITQLRALITPTYGPYNPTYNPPKLPRPTKHTIHVSAAWGFSFALASVSVPQGRHPVSGVFVASPVLVDLAQDVFTIVLGG